MDFPAWERGQDATWVRKKAKEILTSPESALRALIAAGICEENGQLRPEYRRGEEEEQQPENRYEFLEV